MSAALLALFLAATDDSPKVPAKLQRAGGDEKKKYYLIGDAKAAAPKGGFGLLVVMPGGDGSADFHPFVKTIHANATPPGYLTAQLVAVVWDKKQEIVWPTANDKKQVPGMTFTTEAFAEAVIDDVAGKYAIDKGKVFTLSWSSSGPAAYPLSLTSKKVAGSFVAMSVFRPDWFPPLAGAKGKPYYLYHSPDDETCPFEMAADAKAKLEEAGATVKLKTYDGGHGWRGPAHDDIKDGLRWLEANAAKR